MFLACRILLSLLRLSIFKRHLFIFLLLSYMSSAIPLLWYVCSPRFFFSFKRIVGNLKCSVVQSLPMVFTFILYHFSFNLCWFQRPSRGDKEQTYVNLGKIRLGRNASLKHFLQLLFLKIWQDKPGTSCWEEG